MMKKRLILGFFIFSLMFIVGACGQNEDDHQPDANAGQSDAGETVIYESELGPVEIPANPQRIVALSYAPNVLALGGNLVGVDEWTYGNPLFTERVKDIEIVSDQSLESIVAQQPDLIIAGSHTENLEEIQKIAPTVVYTWGKLDYLQQQLEIGKLLNKEEEAEAWIQEFKQRTAELSQKIKEKHGDITVTVFETDAKNFYVFGNNWARGTEILYQAMELGMPEKVKEDALETGYYTLSLEVLPEYAGDFIVLSTGLGDNAFMESEIWKSIPAVKNGRVIEMETKKSTYSDPITLEYLTDVFEEGFLNR